MLIPNPLKVEKSSYKANGDDFCTQLNFYATFSSLNSACFDTHIELKLNLTLVFRSS
jgi:hypothetical protein